MNLLKSKYLIKLIFIFLALILLFGGSSQVAQSQPQCPPGFSFSPIRAWAVRIIAQHRLFRLHRSLPRKARLAVSRSRRQL